MIIDIVTSREANIHNEIMRLMGDDEVAFRLPEAASLYAVAYRPAVRGDAEEVDVWREELRVGGTLPVLPLALDAETCLPLDLETTYMAARKRRRLN